MTMLDDERLDLIAGPALLLFVLLWFFSGSLLWAVCLTGGLAVTIWAALAGHLRRCFGWMKRLGRWLAGWRWRGKPLPAASDYDRYDLPLGVEPETRQSDIDNLAEMGHIGVYGVTRFGKTTLIHSFLHHLIGTHRPGELRLAISDPKRLDYPFYGALPHLLCPIARDGEETARLVKVLLAEMERRTQLFAPFAQSQLCNSLEMYAQMSGERLPRVLAVFDELADVVDAGSQLEADLIRLAKLGLGYGIQLLCGTQRPSARVMNGELKSQFASFFATWMTNNREYGTVAMIPKEMYEQMTPVRGRFMVYTPSGGWRFVQGVKVPDRALAQLAQDKAGRPRLWQRLEIGGADAVSTRQWTLSGPLVEREKIVSEWLAGWTARPTAAQMMAVFGCSEPTALKYINKLWMGGE